MNGLKISATFAAALAFFALDAMGQGNSATTDPRKTPKAEETKDPAKAPPPKKAEPKKAEPKKTEPPKKADPKKAPPKKVDTKAQATSHGGTVQKYEAGNAPALKDSRGNVIQTSPDAYDISSATNPPPKKK
jgi:neurofilament heavy polypeptide